MTTQVVFSFDTTGSMYPCLAEVRRRLAESVGKVLAEVPGVQVGLVAHGDACDGLRGYEHLDFTDNLASLQGWIKTVRATYGGDSDEWYEHVLDQVASDFSWDLGEDVQRMLVLIGDAQPHRVGYRHIGYVVHADETWQAAADRLVARRIMVHTVQCLAREPDMTRFWGPLAAKTNGYAVQLAQFQNITELIVALGYRYTPTLGGHSNALVHYESELRSSGRLNRNIGSVIDTLMGRTVPTAYVDKTHEEQTLAKIAVDPSRFQVFRIDADCRINDFVRDMGLTFKVGRGFYQYSKPVLVQHYKEIVLRDKASGDMFTGDFARKLLGLPVGSNAKLKHGLGRYDVFIQSTSATRKLLGGTEFMYEVDKSYGGTYD